MLKRYTSIIVVLLFGLVNLSAQNLPKVKVQNIAGTLVESKDWVNGETPFILSFWSTTCKPCIQELDALNENYIDWNDEVPFRVIAVSIDDSRSASRAKALARGRGWSDVFTLGFDTNSDLKRSLSVVSVPQVFIFDKDGKMIYSHTGYTPGNEYELIEKIKELK